MKRRHAIGNPEARHAAPRILLLAGVMAASAWFSGAAPVQVAVTTSQYDNARTGADLHEETLTPANVNVRQFGRLDSIEVDGDVFAQPLYLPGVEIPGGGRHNLIFSATEHDSVYAFDADGQQGRALWRTNFLDEPNVTPMREADVGCSILGPEVGITSTPVIDASSGTLYVVVRTKEKRVPVQRLHALDVATGREKFGGPVEIQAPGFNALMQDSRAALLLTQGTVYVSFASICDRGPYHGWVMAYDARTLRQLGALNVSPNDPQGGGIWAADTGPAADAEGHVFVATGNGKFDAS